jgi:hypothetical protein
MCGTTLDAWLGWNQTVLMTITQLTLTLRSSTQQVLATARHGLDERRQALAERRQLKRELASYITRAEVDDLLASLSGQDEASVNEIRTIVRRNLHADQRLLGIAS